MVIEVMKRRVVAFLSLMACIPAAVIRAAEPGTIGVQVSQLYSDQQETHRGGLVIRRVVPASGAAEAGLRPGDLILGVDGQSVEGHERKEFLGWLNGTAGTLVQLTVISQDGRREVRVRRKPYPPHLNSASDPFSYQIPGNWLVDPRYTFPLPWAVDLRYEGFEDVGFSPGFDDPDSAEYHSYFFLWRLSRETSLSSEGLRKDLTTYFRGLAEQRGRNNKFAPDLSQIHVSLKPLPAASVSVEGDQPQGFGGSFTIYDRRGQIVDLKSEVISAHCTNASGMAVLFFVSREPRPSRFWDQLDAIRKSFKCRRE
jgi:hypothetical protein